MSSNQHFRNGPAIHLGPTGPPAGALLPVADLRCLTGVRAVASVGVVCFHCFSFWQFFLDHKTKYDLTLGQPLIRLASAGMLWVDVMLMLSVLLAAYQLVPLMEERRQGAPSCRTVVLRYWRRRAARVLPGYVVANLLALLALGPADGVPREASVARWLHFYHCPRTLWANALFLQNWLGPSACAIHLWTVALQVQFYAAFPLALLALRPCSQGFRARLAAALAATFALGTAWRLWAASQVDFLELPVADFAVDEASQRSWANMLTASYLPTAGRAAQLAGGAALGLLLRSPTALAWLRRRRPLVAVAALGLQATYAHLLMQRHLLFRQPGAAPWPLPYARMHIALLSFGGPFVTALVGATLLALILHADPVHALAARLLGAGPWRPLADLSYAQYLMHEQARLWVLLLCPAGLVSGLIVQRPLLGFAAVTLGTLGAGYACALPLHHALLKGWQ